MKSTRQSSNEFYGNVILGDNVTDTHSVTGSLTSTSIIKTIDTTNSTTWTNGAMVIDGGVGIGKDVWISGSLNVLGSTNIINVSSSQLIIEDNIITVNGYSPYLRYAGIEAIDSGSGITSSLLWDGQNDYWLMISSSNQSSRLLGTTFGSFGSETSLTNGYIPRATSGNTIANSSLFQSASNIGYGTTTPAEPVVITANGSTVEFATGNNGNYGLRTGSPIKAAQFYLYNTSGDIKAFNGTSLISAPDTANKLSFLSDKMFISSSGNVGIGTTSPPQKFTVFGTGLIATFTDNIASNLGISLGFDSTSTTNAYLYSKYAATGGKLNFGFGETLGNSNVMTLVYGGNIGIGTTSPNAKLHVSGSTNITGSFTVASGSSGTAILRSFETASGNYKAGDFWVLGDLYVGPGSSKYFTANNPNGIKETTDSIKYVAIEGPSKSVFHHGKSFVKKDIVEILLPQEWEWLVDENSITATLSPIEKYANLTYQIKNNKLIVYNKSWFKRNIHFSYQLIGDRKDVEKLKVYNEFPL